MSQSSGEVRVFDQGRLVLELDPGGRRGTTAALAPDDRRDALTTTASHRTDADAPGLRERAEACDSLASRGVLGLEALVCDPAHALNWITAATV